MKSVWTGYFIAFAVIAAASWAFYQYGPDLPRWVFLLPWIVLLSPLYMHLSRRMVTLRFHDEHLTLEQGFLARTRRTVDVAKVQDVTVRQTLGQRLMGVGDLVLESAGEAGAMGISNLDRPREIADTIIAASRKAHRPA